MKVLYIGCYRDGTGWAHAAQGYILSLDAAGIDVVPRFIKLNENNSKVPRRIAELEKKDDKGCDIVIQHVLPHQAKFNGNLDKNICLYVAETDHCRNNIWAERINLMDEAWVPNTFMAEEFCINSNIITPHRVLPHAFDVSKYQKQYEPLEIPYLKDKFVFYYIGEISRRKNIGALLKAFHLEFAPDEEVAILIKGHMPGASANESLSHLQEMSHKVKDGLKIYPSEELYHKELFVCDYISEEEIMQIHASCDCFVSPSFGEAWGIPIFDAMSMGKTPICVEYGGPKDFLGDGGYFAKSRIENCFGAIDTFEDMYVGSENWCSIDINSLRQSMRSVYENKEERERKASVGINNSYNYSYLNVGKKMQQALVGQDDKNLFNKQSKIKEKHLIKW